MRASHSLTTSQRPTVAGSCGKKAALKDGPAPTGQDTHPRLEKTKEAAAGNRFEAASPTHKSGYIPQEFSFRSEKSIHSAQTFNCSLSHCYKFKQVLSDLPKSFFILKSLPFSVQFGRILVFLEMPLSETSVTGMLCNLNISNTRPSTFGVE